MTEEATHELSPEQGARALRAFLGQGAMAGVYMSVGQGGGALLGVYAMLILGMSKEDAGFVGAFTFLAGFVQLLSFLVTNRVRHKKAFVLLVGSMEMVVLSCVLLVPLLLPGQRLSLVRQASFLALVFLSSSCQHLVAPLVSSWLSEVLPPARRGRYLGLRNLLMMGCQAALGPCALIAVSRWPTLGGFAAVILLCCASGVAGYLLLSRAPMPRVSRESLFSFRGMWRSRRHGPFRRYFVFMVFLNAPFAIACAYYVPFFFRVVGLTQAQLAMYVAGYSAVRFAGMWPAGHLVDRVGARPVLHAMLVIYALFFLSFPFFTVDRLWLIVAMWAMVGVADSCWMVAVTSTLFHSLPRSPERAGYLALAQGSMLLFMGVGPFLVRLYLEWAEHLRWTVLGLSLDKFRLMYAFCGLLVLLAHFPARRVEDTHDVRLGQLVSLVFRMLPFRMVPAFWRRRQEHRGRGGQPGP